MTNSGSDTTWIKYLEELHVWITTLYGFATNGKIAEDKYFEGLKHYNNEVSRVTKYIHKEKLIPPLPLPDITIKKKKSVINPEMIQGFFDTETDNLEVPNITKTEQKSSEIKTKEPSQEKSQNIGLKSVKEEPVVKSLRVASKIEEKTFTIDKGSNVGSAQIPKETNVLQDQASLKNMYTSLLKIKDHREEHGQKVELVDEVVRVRTSEPDLLKSLQKPKSLLNKTSTKSATAKTLDTRSMVKQREKITVKSKPGSVGKPKVKAKTINIVLIGNSGTGTTAIKQSFLGKNFVSRHLSTMGAAIDEKAIVVKDQKLLLNLIDLAGADFYAPIRVNFYRNVSLALVVYDVTDRTSFQQIDKWINELYFNSGKRAVPFLLVANKVDLKRKIKKKEGIKLAKKLSQQTKMYGFEVPYLEVSAKKNWNIQNLFKELVVQKIQKTQH